MQNKMQSTPNHKLGSKITAFPSIITHEMIWRDLQRIFLEQRAQTGYCHDLDVIHGCQPEFECSNPLSAAHPPKLIATHECFVSEAVLPPFNVESTHDVDCPEDEGLSTLSADIQPEIEPEIQPEIEAEESAPSAEIAVVPVVEAPLPIVSEPPVPILARRRSMVDVVLALQRSALQNQYKAIQQN